jgi:hypothetical protein
MIDHPQELAEFLLLGVVVMWFVLDQILPARTIMRCVVSLYRFWEMPRESLPFLIARCPQQIT